MTILLGVLLGLFLGFVIGALARNQNDNFISGIQKHLKKGQMFSISISRFGVDDDDDDDGGDPGKHPLFLRTERFRDN